MSCPPTVTVAELLDRETHWRFLHEVVRNARLSCCCTQEHFARRIGISQRHLRRIETGMAYGGASGFRIRTGQTLELLNKLCFELGLEYDDLLQRGEAA
jgi:transcriptional regulator with XRE-family HTH domain